ncbi:MAG: hypothetical protein ACYS67_01115 [Planctomycetota bacterium]|jgi:formate/nitrite transporter FocA (FNT family)
MRDYGIDAYTPAKMADRVEKAGIVKGNLDFLSVFTLSVLAGAFIAFGSEITLTSWTGVLIKAVVLTLVNNG